MIERAANSVSVRGKYFDINDKNNSRAYFSKRGFYKSFFFFNQNLYLKGKGGKHWDNINFKKKVHDPNWYEN